MTDWQKEASDWQAIAEQNAAQFDKLASALEAIRAKLEKPRDYSHAPSIATLFDEIDEIATLSLAQNVWGAK